MILTHQFKSNVLSDGSYDTESKELNLTFNNGKTYTYEAVEPYLWVELVDAESAGKKFAEIKKQLVLKS